MIGFSLLATCYLLICYVAFASAISVLSMKDREKSTEAPRVVVVGPDAAGKTELVKRLRELGYNARSCAQDHSYVPDMWQRISKPDFLVYLDARLETIAQRRVIDWGQERLDTLNARLAHARAHSDLYLPTDDLTASDVVTQVRSVLAATGIVPRQGKETPGESTPQPEF